MHQSLLGLHFLSRNSDPGVYGLLGLEGYGNLSKVEIVFPPESFLMFV